MRKRAYTLKSITDLTMTISRPDISEQDKLKEICLTIKDNLASANRVSIWTFTEECAAIRCLICLDENQQYSAEQILTREEHMEYFDFILKSQVLRASQAHVHPATSCFTKDYFSVYDINSLLDYIFHHDFKPAGVICCEKTGDPVEWSDEDVDVLRRVSNIVSMFLFEY